MAKRKILIFPDARLRKAADPVGEVDDRIRRLADDLLDTMYDAPGIGLAAPQVGILRRIFVMDCSRKEKDKIPKIFVDPELVWESEETEKHEEGCLSLPGQFADVHRPASVAVEYRNQEGQRMEEEFSGMEARCIQHEIDHLDGRLFIDRISLIKRQIIQRKMVKLHQERRRK